MAGIRVTGLILTAVCINIILYTLIVKDAVMEKESSLQTTEKDDTMESKLVCLDRITSFKKENIYHEWFYERFDRVPPRIFFLIYIVEKTDGIIISYIYSFWIFVHTFFFGIAKENCFEYKDVRKIVQQCRKC